MAHSLRFSFFAPAMLVGLAALCLAGCASDDRTTEAAARVEPTTTTERPGPVATRVTVKSSSFEPSTVTIAVGETVAWAFVDTKLMHNVVGQGFQSSLRRGGSFSHTFATAGTFDYRCTIHPQMKGVVEVS